MELRNEETLKANLARNMRFLRLQRKPLLSQKMLAKKLGVTQKSISRYETARCLPPAHVLLAMADIFGFTADELFGENLPDRKGRENNE